VKLGTVLRHSDYPASPHNDENEGLRRACSDQCDVSRPGRQAGPGCDSCRCHTDGSVKLVPDGAAVVEVAANYLVLRLLPFPSSMRRGHRRLIRPILFLSLSPAPF
jgi:hypothetical protein